MLNPFFQQGSSGEQNLVQDIINEQLRIYGINVHYLPRKYLTQNTVLKEVIESKFDDAYPIEAYIESFEGYGDNPTLLSKFGIQATNEITLIISKERFETYISPLMKNESDVKLSTRPKEGDLIYFPLGDRLFEIKYVEHEKPFYQLQKNYVYELRCELFRIEDEVIDTGVEEIDNELIGDDYDGTSESGVSTIIGVAQLLYVVGTGTTATALTSLVNNGIRFIRLTNRGAGYNTLPTVGVSSVGVAGSVTGIGTASQMISGINVCNTNTNNKLRSVQQVAIVNPGTGYTSAPTVKFSGGGGSGAAATSGISTTGGVGVVTVSSSGGGYVNSPTVTFSTPKHVGASATAVINSGSVVSAPISIGSSAFLFPGGTTGGAFYRTAPTVTFGAPTGSGATATGIATIRFNSLNYQGTVGIGSTTITGINTLGVIVGDRVRLGIGYSDSYNFIAENAFVSGIGQSSLIMSTAATNVGIATSVFELGRDQCGIVTGIIITSGGSGYATAPVVSISNTVGDKNYIDFHATLGIATATGISTLTSAGAIEKIYITDSGHGYVITPTITIEDPASDSTGSFKFNEIITGSLSGTTARVRIWNESTNQLEVMNVTGSFTQGETLTGAESGAQYVFRKSETFPPLTNFADNNAIETEADAILDFSEENPFGTP